MFNLVRNLKENYSFPALKIWNQFLSWNWILYLRTISCQSNIKKIYKKCQQETNQKMAVTIQECILTASSHIFPAYTTRSIYMQHRSTISKRRIYRSVKKPKYSNSNVIQTKKYIFHLRNEFCHLTTHI